MTHARMLILMTLTRTYLQAILFDTSFVHNVEVVVVL